ncbi:MAG: PorV/PorQ family protein [Rhodothermales bacterium]|nr:PorV/PorQ family protein [Rhodothermales bacterium]MBO6780400.1 PorV/PorQ family protein [Rhodothermales bacterium]
MRRLLPLVLLLAALPARGQSSGLAFLEIGPDAAGMALGDAGVALATGPFVVERNPAGLAAESGSALGLTHHQWIADVSTYGVAGRFDAGGLGSMGLFVRATGTTDLESRQRPGPRDGTFDVQFVSAGAALARNLGPVRLGITGRYLSERIFSASATGYAADFGVQLPLVRESVTLGAALLNVGSMEELVDRPTELPTTVRVGAAVAPFRVLSFEDGATLIDAVLTVEFSQNTVTEQSRLHVGAATTVLETVQVRLGYVSNDALRDFSAGLGFEAGGIRLDYALLPFEAGFGGPGHVFSLVYGGSK